jgi:hypothetical protein
MNNFIKKLEDCQERLQAVNEKISLVLFSNKDYECNEEITNKYNNIKENH